MKDINKQFIQEFKKLIDKEKESNKSILANVDSIKGNILSVSIKNNSKLTKNMPVELNRIPSIITEANNKNLTIKLSKQAEFNVNQKVRIQNIQKEIIINKLQETLDSIVDNKINKENKRTLKTITDTVDITFNDEKHVISPQLNKNQRASVKRALCADKFHMIQGPPGTGKTHTIVEIINQLYKKDMKILITTHTHIAIDNILERLDDIDEGDILRIGSKDKISAIVYKYSLEEHIKNHPDYKKIVEKEDLIAQLENYGNFVDEVNPPNPKRNNIINRIFKHLLSIDENENTLNNYVNDVTNYKNSERIDEIKEEILQIKNHIQSDILKNVKIISSTVISSSSFLTKDIEFDYVIMDEASQVPVYLSLIALLKTDKFILIGDNKQLQPIQNENANYFLNKSIFNLLIDKYPDNYSFLNIQYRMNHEISDIASKLYYDGKLLTGDGVYNQKIGLDNDKDFLLNDDAITFIDTSGVDFNESNISGGCCNKYESLLIVSIIKSLIDNGFSEDEIGIITPYRRQKIYIQRLLLDKGIGVECDTIYRFQGREKDIILLSFCKSSNKSLTRFQANFLADKNQLNVSITRSRKKLIIIGNYDMLRSAENIRNLVNELSMENILFLEDMIGV